MVPLQRFSAAGRLPSRSPTRVMTHERLEFPRDRVRRTVEPVPASMRGMDKLFISAESLLRDSIALGMQVIRSNYRPTFLVGVWRGGAPIGICVQEVLEYHGVECDHIAIRTSSYGAPDQRAKAVRVHAIDYLVSRLGAEDRLLLIDDVFDTGLSLEAVIDELSKRCRRNLPESIRIATVYSKPNRNRSSLQPHYFVRATDQWLVFPHEMQGLTREEILRYKPVDETFFNLL
jgi:hypoxanthine phosphoribosyltransferase